MEVVIIALIMAVIVSVGVFLYSRIGRRLSKLDRRVSELESNDVATRTGHIHKEYYARPSD